MQLIPQPQDAGSAAKFKLYGFPEETSVRAALENAYRQAQASANFLIYNMFDELIFAGAMDGEGRVALLEAKDRLEDKAKYKKED